jgi:hypothetical protein
MMPDDEMRAVMRHVAEEERIGDLPQKVSLFLFDGNPAVPRLAGFDRLSKNCGEFGRCQRRPRLRGGGKLPSERLTQEIVEGCSQRSLCGRP